MQKKTTNSLIESATFNNESLYKFKYLHIDCIIIQWTAWQKNKCINLIGYLVDSCIPLVSVYVTLKKEMFSGFWCTTYAFIIIS